MAAKTIGNCFAMAVVFLGGLLSAQSTESRNRVVLEFTDSQCPACRQLQPVVDHLVDQGWVIRQVHRSYEPELYQRWRVQQTPTLIVLEDGREVDRMVGAMNYERLAHRLLGDELLTEPSKGNLRVPHEPSYGASNSQGPIVRGQSPLNSLVPLSSVASLSSMAMDEARATRSPERLRGDLDLGREAFGRRDPMESTVRIVVDDGSSESVGTGTIIDTHGNEALVLTCGHLFRDSGGKADIFIDLFVGGVKQRLTGRVVDYRADQVDIGLVSFQFAGTVPVAEIRPSHEPLRENEVVFSIGCDAGADPSRRDSRITKLNRYLGPENVEAAGAPVQGRSGGGLFDAQGRLVGVCYAADQEWNEGLYAGPQVIYSQLDRIGLQRLAKR